jgi:hypothetical protein
MKTLQDMVGDERLMVFANMCEWETLVKFKGVEKEYSFSAFVNMPVGYPEHYTVPRQYWEAEQTEKFPRGEKGMTHANFPWGKWQVFVKQDDGTNLWIGETEYVERKLDDHRAVQKIGREYLNNLYEKALNNGKEEKQK